MRVSNDGGYQIDTDKARLDVPQVHDWLSTQAYWALGRSLELVTTSIANSLPFGLYAPTGEQVGFCRIVTDGATFAWLCDVFIAPAARGLGLGTWLAEQATGEVFRIGVRRVILATADAHGVYAKVGFTSMARPERWMEIDQRATP